MLGNLTHMFNPSDTLTETNYGIFLLVIVHLKSSEERNIHVSTFSKIVLAVFREKPGSTIRSTLKLKRCEDDLTKILPPEIVICHCKFGDHHLPREVCQCFSRTPWCRKRYSLISDSPRNIDNL